MLRALTRQSALRLTLALSLVAALAIAAWAVALPAIVHADHGLPHGTILARGAFVEATDIKIKSTLGGDKRVMNVNDSAEVIVQNVTIEPRAQTGWHSHHGPVIVVVAAGTMTLYQADDPTCAGESYTVGEAFVDPGRETSTTPGMKEAWVSSCWRPTSTCHPAPALPFLAPIREPARGSEPAPGSDCRRRTGSASPFPYVLPTLLVDDLR